MSRWLSLAYGVALIVVLASASLPIGKGGMWGKVGGAITHTALFRALLSLINSFPAVNKYPPR
jgi:hypothetical protein